MWDVQKRKRGLLVKFGRTRHPAGQGPLRGKPTCREACQAPPPFGGRIGALHGPTLWLQSAFSLRSGHSKRLTAVNKRRFLREQNNRLPLGSAL